MINTEEKLQKFQDEAIPSLKNACLKLIRKHYEENTEELSNTMVAEFVRLLLLVQQMQKGGKFGKLTNIIFSVLKSGYFDISRLCRIDAYDEDITNKQCYIELDFPWIRDHISNFEKDISLEMRNFGIVLPGYTIENIALQEMLHLCDILHFLLRYSVPGLENSEKWESIEKFERVFLRYGEYYGNTEIFYTYDARILDSEQVKSDLRGRRARQYESYKNLLLSNGVYDGANLNFTDFSGCDFSESSFKNCSLVGTSWRGCNLESVDFSGSNLSGADFRNASIATTNFVTAVLTKTLW